MNVARMSPVVVAAIVACTTGAAIDARAQPAGNPQATAPAAGAMDECLFVKGTAIPRLAMGVLRPGDPPEFRSPTDLELWATPSPAATEAPAAVRPLFVPLYVYEERAEGGTTWYRLGDAYAASPQRGTTGPLGWVDGRRLHQLDGRYAYHFNNPKRVPPGVQLYDARRAAYEALAARRKQPGGTTNANADVLVAERLEKDYWDPLVAGAVPPFVELREPPGQPVAAKFTDTTLTFAHAENRLLYVGAVCGGPLPPKDLDAVRAEAQKQPGIEIAFVIDETESMERYFPEVAAFIDKNLAVDGKDSNVKIAVSWYGDEEIPKGDGTAPRAKRPASTPGPLDTLVAPGMQPGDVEARKQAIVKAVRDHKQFSPRGDRTSRELVFAGVGTAIQKANFAADGNAMVFVIGDAADRSDPATLAEHYRQIADLIATRNLQIAFIQVGDQADPDDEFIAQARALQAKLPADKRGNVMIQEVNAAPLAAQIKDFEARMAARRKELRRTITRLEAFNRYAKPGPAMERLIEADGLSLEQFNDRKLQYFAPAYGWLYHPEQPDATPQLRELVFLAKPEVDALMATLIAMAKQIRRTGRIDGDAAVGTLATILARNSNHSQVEQTLRDAWAAMPADSRSFGGFLRDVLGVRVRNAILHLHHRGPTQPGAVKPGPATARAATFLEEHKERLAGARTRTPPPVWYDAWKVLP